MAPNSPAYTYSAVITRVLDGDTVEAEISLGFRLKLELVLRLKGIDTPKLSTPDGKLAKKELESYLSLGKKVIIRTFKDRPETRGRFLAEIFVWDGSTQFNVNAWMRERWPLA